MSIGIAPFVRRYAVRGPIFALFIACFASGSAVAQTDRADDSDERLRRSAHLGPNIWRQSSMLVSPDPKPGDDDFGEQVALGGDTAVVTAPGFPSDTDGDGVREDRVGAVFPFERVDGNWTSQSAISLPNPTPGGDRQGFGSSLSLDGKTLAVYAENVEGNSAGQPVGGVFIFVRANGTWKKQTRLKSPERGQLFGFDVVLDGDTLYVGAPAKNVDIDNDGKDENNVGSVYVYTRSQGVWSEKTQLQSDDPNEMQFFGTAVSVDGDRAVVGAYQEARDVDGDSMLENEVGSAFVFERDGGSWSEVSKWTAPEPETNQWFGRDVAIRGDRALVGAPLDSRDVDGDGNDEREVGLVVAYERSEGSWSQTETLTGPSPGMGQAFGFDLSLEEERAFIAAPLWSRGGRRVGATTLYERGESGWNRKQTISHPEGDAETQFARSIAVSDDSLMLTAPKQALDLDSDGTVTDDVGSVFVYNADEDGDGIADSDDNCPDRANPRQGDADGDGTGDLCEECPDDPNKTAAGMCGCGSADDDGDGDGIPDCMDECPAEAPSGSADSGVQDGCPEDEGGESTSDSACSTTGGGPSPWQLAVLVAGALVALRRRDDR